MLKIFEILKWKTRLSDKEAFKMTFDWYKNYYSKASREKIYKFSFNQVNKVYQSIKFNQCYYQFVYQHIIDLKVF